MRHGRVDHLENCGDPLANIIYQIDAMFVKVEPMIPVFLININYIHELYFVNYENLRISEYIKENKRL